MTVRTSEEARTSEETRAIDGVRAIGKARAVDGALAAEEARAIGRARAVGKARAIDGERAVGKVLAEAEVACGAAGEKASRALRFVRACLDRAGRLPVDAEWPFLLEDLKGAGVPGPQLRAVRDALRADNGAAGREKLATESAQEGRSSQDREPSRDGETSQDERPTAPSRSVALKWKTMEDELDGVARYVQQTLRRSDGDGASRAAAAALVEQDVCVAAPDVRWARLVQKALEHRRLAVSRTQLGYALGGDPRDARKAAALSAFNRLNLLAHPDDPLAWRVWCGLGERDLGAARWAAFLARCEDACHGGACHEGAYGEGALAGIPKALEDEGVAGDAALAVRAREAREFVAAKGGLRGFSLSCAAGIDAIDEFSLVNERIEGDEDAPALFALATDLLCGPTYSSNPHAVRVTTYDALGESRDGLLVIVAAVEGLVPPDPTRLHEVIGRAKGDLVISSFSRTPVEVADRLGLAYARTRKEPSGEVALTRPSATLASLGGSLPPTQDGTAFLEVEFGRQG